MKKYVIICLLALVGVVISGCKKNEPTMEKRTVDLTANRIDWTFDQDINMYFCHFNVPEITAQVYNYGEFSVHREYNSGTSQAYQVALPETTYKVEQLEDTTGAPFDVYYQQHIDYAIGIGYVEIFYTISDYFYPDGFKPDGMIFRLQMTY